MKKKIIYTIIGLIIIGLAGFLYITRPALAPSGVTLTGELTAQDGELYQVNAEQSLATFQIDEILNGSPFTVVGTTNALAGELAIKDGTMTFGTFSINARTFKTDNERRNGAIARLILKAEQPENEFITFKPTQASGDTANIVDGAEHKLAITGDLTISGITKSVIFDTTVVVIDDVVTGSASAVIKRSDFELVIPNLSFVAGVPDEFIIKADIVAGKAL